VAKLGPNLIMLRFKVGTNGVLCLLDSRVMHPFVNPKCSYVTQVGGYKNGQTHQGPINTISCNTDKQGGVGGHFGMWQYEVYGKPWSTPWMALKPS
jgi:hypothetical protein